MVSDLRDITSVDRLIHEPARLLIIAILNAVDHADFLYLLHETGLTKGNLSAHLAKLEAGGYVTITKSFRGKVPLTTCALSEAGRAAFRQYRRQMKRAVGNLDE